MEAAAVTEAETVALLVDLLESREPFCHVRFGDGDVFFATGTGPTLTADGEEWSSGLQWQLINAWGRVAIARHRLLVGDVSSYAVDDGCGHEWDVMREYAVYLRGKDLSPMELVHIEALRAGFGYALPAYQAIAADPRKKLYIGPKVLEPAAEMLKADFREVPLHVAWEPRPRRDALEGFEEYEVILFSAGRGGKIMQGQICHSGHHPVTQIDIGSGLDILFGGVKRGTDAGVDIDALKAQYRDAGLL